MQMMESGLNTLLDGIGAEFAAMMRKHEKDATTTSSQYSEGLKRFATTHICNLKNWPDELRKSFRENEEDPTVFLRT